MADTEPTTVSIKKAYEARHWARVMQCTVEELVAAVHIAGPEPQAVKRQLGAEAPWGESDLQSLDDETFFSKTRKNSRLSGFLNRAAGAPSS